MKREEQELLERDEGNESQEEEPVVDQQADRLEDAFDRKFWIKVSKAAYSVSPCEQSLFYLLLL